MKDSMDDIMHAHYFRLMFQNTDDGICHTGSILNTYENAKLNFMYLSGSTANIKKRMEPDQRFNKETYTLDYLVVGSFNPEYLNKMLNMMQNRRVTRIILPYLTPVERVALLLDAQKQRKVNPMLQKFLADPYIYLRERGVHEIYLIYNNGRDYNGQTGDALQKFEPIDDADMEMIRKIEGYDMPVVKAGYMLEQGWLFYFYHSGIKIEELAEFTLDHLDQCIEPEAAGKSTAENVQINSMKVVERYKEKFPDAELPTVVFYHGPVDDSPKMDNCYLVTKSFSKMQPCGSEICNDFTHCMTTCFHNNDFDVLKKHKGFILEHYLLGTLLLGNIKITRNIELLYKRFQNMKERVRFLAVPNSGHEKYWDRRILGFGLEHHRKFLICANNENTSDVMIKEICMSSPYNRYTMLDEYFGLCCSGFLKDKNDTDVAFY